MWGVETRPFLDINDGFPLGSIIQNMGISYCICKEEPHFVKDRQESFDVVHGYLAKEIVVPKDLQRFHLVDELIQHVSVLLRDQ